MLPVDGMCPECGTRIQRTLSFREFASATKFESINRITRALLIQSTIGSVALTLSLSGLYFGGPLSGLVGLMLVAAISMALCHGVCGCALIGATRELFPLKWLGCNWPVIFSLIVVFAANAIAASNAPALLAGLLLVGVFYVATIGVMQGVAVSANTLAEWLHVEGSALWAKLALWGVCFFLVVMLLPPIIGYQRLRSAFQPHVVMLAEPISHLLALLALSLPYCVMLWLLYRATRSFANRK